MTPEEAVKSAVANARLAGIEIDEEHQELMLRVARGELPIEDAIVWIKEGIRTG